MSYTLDTPIETLRSEAAKKYAIEYPEASTQWLNNASKQDLVYYLELPKA